MLSSKIVKGTVALGAALVGAALPSSAAEEKGQLQVLVRHPKEIVATPMEQFAGRLDKQQGDSIEVTFAVDERSYLQYRRLVQKHEVTESGSRIDVGLVYENGFPYKGTLKGFGNQVDSTTGTIEAHATLPNPDRMLLAGMFVRVRMPFGPLRKRLQIPERSLLSDQVGRYVLVVAGDGIVERRAVSVGVRDDDMRFVQEGVGADDWIVVGSVGGLINKVIPGTHVRRRIVDDAPKKGVNGDKRPAG